MSTTLGRVDSFRARSDATAPSGLKEWQHFVVHGHDARVIVNLSISRDEEPVGRHLGRVIVLVHHTDWAGVIDEVDVTDVELDRGGTVGGRFGSTVLGFEDGCYTLDIEIRRARIRGHLRFRSVSTPFLKNNQPLGGGRMSWLFVPRLVADGHLTIGATRFGMREAVAYHDHNWGPFRWGDDFGWQWGSALPTSHRDPWSLVFMRMTDRAHTAARSQCLYVWKGGEPAAMFRDGAVSVELSGFLGRPPRLTIPPMMNLVAPGSASDVPRAVRLDARRGDDRVSVAIEPAEHARIAIPSEIGGREIVALHEVSADVLVSGRIGGERVDMEGSGVFEFLR